MNKYFITIEELKKQLKLLEQEKSTIQNELSLLSIEFVDLSIEIGDLTHALSLLEQKADQKKNSQHFFNNQILKKAIEFGAISMISIAGIGLTKLIFNGAFNIAVEHVIGACLGAGAISTTSYFLATNKTRKYIKGIKVDDVEQQISEKKQEINEKKHIYSAAMNKSNIFKEQIEEKRKNINFINRQILDLELIKNEAVNNQFIGDVEQQVTFEQDIVEEKKMILI